MKKSIIILVLCLFTCACGANEPSKEILKREKYTNKEQINKEKLLELENDYTIMSLVKMENNQYTEEELNNYFDLMKEHFYVDGIINCPYIEGNNIVDTLILIPKTELINV